MPHRLYAPVAARARFRCEYCRAPEEISPDRFQAENIRPRARGGDDNTSNLALSCPPCNRHKSDATHGVDPHDGRIVPLFNPRGDVWVAHFRFRITAESILIVGRTSTGRATVERLAMNDAHALRARLLWVLVGLYPPRS